MSDLRSLRRLVEDGLEQPLSDRAWDLQVRRGRIAELAEDLNQLGSVLRLISEDLEAYGDVAAATKRPGAVAAREAPVGDDMEAERCWAVAKLLAADAAELAVVKAFRQEVLDGRLLAFDEVQPWVEEQQRRDGDPTRYATDVPLGEGLELRIEDDGRCVLRGEGTASGVDTRILRYFVPGDDDAGWQVVATARGGVLERLRRLAADLCTFYSWSSDLAVLFVLTGGVPEHVSLAAAYQPPSIRSRVGGADVGLFELGAMSCTERVVLRIDPAVPPREVANAYAEQRKRLRSARVRALGSKSMQLAVFAAERPRDEPWAGRMSAWNKKHSRKKDWRYDNVRNFHRDAHAAQRRLLNPESGGVGSFVGAP